MKLKKNDNVKIIVGKDNGKTGIVEYAKNNKLIIKGINIQKKHIKPSQKNPKGGIIDINKRVDSSDAMLICPSCGKTTRIGYKIDKNQKIRICKKCQKSVDEINKK